ncbi:hypothetical protein HBA55_32515 [Pseudomaricurvus alkylphenolicus]|uniref:hypothetical protein n=1 Tax=Pseudomaricurvus alkylphenolicus TaxID=1306991 RepID=UPI00142059AD|nr:hypothetical protein [Pseudomaricurvus alkylphenolicus]NIB44363.1 hypothetical protein [Pseudomaricurvus alkylphenolicus]
MPKDSFILSVINGAYAPTGGENDRALLINKHKVSMYYVEQTVLDPHEAFDENINALISAVSSDASSVDIAKDIIDYAFEHDPLTLTGIVEDEALWGDFWGAT